MAIKDFFPSVRPALDINFSASQLIDPRVTFTRAGTGAVASYFNQNGTRAFALPNVPRIDFDPVTGRCLGLLMEEQRTNLLLNSATLSSQNVTVTAVVHTLSFYGTGTVTISGASYEVLVGTAVNNRVQLSFTPTAGTLTVTVTGSVTEAQLEVGTRASTYIPTTSSQVTRAADAMSITGSNFTNVFNQNEGTVVVEAEYFGQNSSDPLISGIVSLTDGSGFNFYSIVARPETSSSRMVVIPGNPLTSVTNSFPVNTVRTVAMSFKNNDFSFCTGGGTVYVNNTNSVATGLNSLIIGAYYSTTNRKLNGRIKRVTLYNRAFPLSLQYLTAQV